MRIGDLLGQRYRLDEYVDGGAMGEVWKATDTRLNRAVAVKVLHASLSGSQAFRRRFEAEARAAAALRAPGVVNVYDFGEDESGEGGSVSFLVMEFVDGRALSNVLADRGRLSPGDVMALMGKVALALEAAHRGGVIHRDVKPGNILMTESGDIKVVDFGIARAHGESGLTSTGQVMGTVAYVSPEQLYDEELSGASDIYSLGVVAYECLAGRKPFAAEAPAAVIRAQLHETPPPLPDNIPSSVSTVVMRCLAKEPGQRWASGAELARVCRKLAARLPQGDSTEAMDAAEVTGGDTTVRIPAPGQAKVGTTRSMTSASRDEGVTPEASGAAGTRFGRKKLVGIVAAALLLLMVVTAAAWRPWEATGDNGKPGKAEETSSSESSRETDDDAESQDQQDDWTATTSPSDDGSSSSSDSDSPTDDSSTPTDDSSTSSDDSSTSSDDKPSTPSGDADEGKGEPGE